MQGEDKGTHKKKCSRNIENLYWNQGPFQYRFFYVSDIIDIHDLVKKSELHPEVTTRRVQLNSDWRYDINDINEINDINDIRDIENSIVFVILFFLAQIC